MKKANRTKRQRRGISSKLGIGPLREIALRVRLRWLMVTFAALGCWITLAVRNGAEQVDSGWAVAIPSPLAKGTAPANSEQELVIRHVLEQTQQPLLKKQATGQSSPSARSAATPPAAGLRFAERSEPSADGWRAA